MEIVEDVVGGKCIYFPFAGNFDRQNAAQYNSVAAPFTRSDVLVLGNIGQECSRIASQNLREIIGVLDPFRLDEGRRTRLVEHVMNDEQHSNVALAVRNFMQLSSTELLKAPIVQFLAALDASEKRRRRLSTIDSVKSMKINIIGAGWRELMGVRPNITYRTLAVQHDYLAGIFATYKVLLDFSPNWDHGFNDRVVTSLGAGCRVVTTRNSAVDELGDAAALISTYSPHHPTPEPEIEKALNASPIDDHLILQLKAKHNWSMRIKEVFT